LLRLGFLRAVPPPCIVHALSPPAATGRSTRLGALEGLSTLPGTGRTFGTEKGVGLAKRILCGDFFTFGEKLPRHVLRAFTIDAFMTVQGRRCGICKQPGDWNIDHDHETGKARGVLCTRCNLALGQFDAQRLRNALRYLESAPERLKSALAVSGLTAEEVQSVTPKARKAVSA
jgi:hypothetical protein